MNLTYGDYILLEIALLQYVKDIDLSTQSGQYISIILGKVEYQLAKLNELSKKQFPVSASKTGPAAGPNLN